MEVTNGLRWSSRGISHGRLRLASRRVEHRFYSLSSRHSPLLRSRRPIASSPAFSVYEQHRQLSLFGWGSSKTGNEEFAQTHTSPTTSSPASDLPQAATSSIGDSSQTPVIEPTRSVKASHATSDSPDPTSPALNTPEPEALGRVQDAISSPDFLAEAATPSIEVPQEYIGYLRDIGLDYGYGIRSSMEYVLEHLHLTAGLSWSASIIILALISRSLIFPFLMRSSDMAARFSRIKDQMSGLQRRFKDAQESGDMVEQQKATLGIRSLLKDNGVSFSAMFVPVIIQLPLAISNYSLMSKAAILPVPGFKAEQWPWMPDLTVGSDFYILPLITSGLLHLQARLNKDMAVGQPPTMVFVLTYILPAGNLIFQVFQPGAVQLYFLGSICSGFVQAFLLRQTWFRNFVGLSSMPQGNKVQASPSSPSSPAAPAAPQMVLKRSPSQTPTSTVTIPVKATTTTSPDYVAPPEQRSLIDRYVDGAKNRMRDLRGTLLGDSTERMKSAEAARQVASSDTYEARARREQHLANEERRRQRESSRAADDNETGGARLTSAEKKKKR